MTEELVNLMAPEVRANPYPLYADLRRRGGAIQIDPFEMWAVSRYDDVVAVLKDPQRFSSEAYQQTLLPEDIGYNPFGSSVVTMDPPQHTKMRNLVSRAFTTASIARLESRIRAVADRLATRLVERQEVDFVSEFALSLPASAIGEMLGLDPALHTRFKQWSDDLVTLLGGFYTPEQFTQIRTTIKDMVHYFTEFIDERRKKPGEDMISDLLQAQVDGQFLTQDELLSFLGALMIAGMETTIHLLGNTMIVLADRPQVVDQVRANPRLIPNLVEEVLRFEPPVHVVFRKAVNDTEIGGTRVPAGAMIMPLLASAGRDEKYHPQPDEFRLDRDKPVNLTFGYGIHFCLGAMLARMEARLGLEAILSRIKSFTRKPGEIEWNYVIHVRGPTTLPLRFEPA